MLEVTHQRQQGGALCTAFSLPNNADKAINLTREAATGIHGIIALGVVVRCSSAIFLCMRASMNSFPGADLVKPCTCVLWCARAQHREQGMCAWRQQEPMLQIALHSEEGAKCSSFKRERPFWSFHGWLRFFGLRIDALPSSPLACYGMGMPCIGFTPQIAHSCLLLLAGGGCLCSARHDMLTQSLYSKHGLPSGHLVRVWPQLLLLRPEPHPAPHLPNKPPVTELPSPLLPKTLSYVRVVP